MVDHCHGTSAFVVNVNTSQQFTVAGLLERAVITHTGKCKHMCLGGDALAGNFRANILTDN